jgi:hypothetical protein
MLEWAGMALEGLRPAVETAESYRISGRPGWTGDQNTKARQRVSDVWETDPAFSAEELVRETLNQRLSGIS